MVSVSPLATRVSMRNMEVVDEVCRSSLGCGGVDLATIALISLTAVLALLVFAAVVHVWDAETRPRLPSRPPAGQSRRRRRRPSPTTGSIGSGTPTARR